MSQESAWLAKLGSGIAMTGRKLGEIPSGLIGARPQLTLLHGRIAHLPLGARIASLGYADDLWAARPTLDRPYPVILLHGTVSTKNVWQTLITRLRADDYVVFAPDYGVHGTQDITASAQDVAAYIEQVLAATGASKVDIVGHSQGGLLARYWINELGGASKTHHLITLAAPHRGTTLLGMLGDFLTTSASQKVAQSTVRRIFGEAGMQQVMGSALLETLASSPDTRPGIRYTCFATQHDSTVVPTTNCFLDGPEEWVENRYIQDLGIARCRHEDLPINPQVQALIHATLTRGLGPDNTTDEEAATHER